MDRMTIIARAGFSALSRELLNLLIKEGACMRQNSFHFDHSQNDSENVKVEMNLLLLVRDRINCALDADATRIDVSCSIAKTEQEIFVVKFKDNIFGEKSYTVILNNENNYYHQKFKHEVLKDYILWFTRFGSIELQLGKTSHAKAVLFLKGLEKDKAEELAFGHVFPAESSTPDILFEEYNMKAPEYYCKKIIKTGFLQHFPKITYEAVFYIEGNKIKLKYNPMLIQSDQENQTSVYTVQERYGVWLCKNYVPVTRKNQWIINRAIRSTDFHAFFNCQEASVNFEQTPCNDRATAIMEDIEREIKKIVAEIVESDDQMQFEWLIYSVCSGM